MNGRWLDITLYLKGQFRPQEPRQGAVDRRASSQQNQPGQGQGQRMGGGGGGGGTYSRRNRLRLSGLPFEATKEEVAAALAGQGACFFCCFFIIILNSGWGLMGVFYVRTCRLRSLVALGCLSSFHTFGSQPHHTHLKSTKIQGWR